MRYRIEITSYEDVEQKRREWKLVRPELKDATIAQRQEFKTFEYVDDVWPVEVKRTILLQEIDGYLPLSEVIAAVNMLTLAPTQFANVETEIAPGIPYLPGTKP